MASGSRPLWVWTSAITVSSSGLEASRRRSGRRVAACSRAVMRVASAGGHAPKLLQFTVPGVDEAIDLLIVEGGQLEGGEAGQAPGRILVGEGATGDQDATTVVAFRKGGHRVAHRRALRLLGDLVQPVEQQIDVPVSRRSCRCSATKSRFCRFSRLRMKDHRRLGERSLPSSTAKRAKSRRMTVTGSRFAPAPATVPACRASRPPARDRAWPGRGPGG